MPYLIALGGSVAVGKSTAARLVVRLLPRCAPTGASSSSPPTASCSPTRRLIERDILARKGFPESYDRRALLRFVADLKSGVEELRAPLYSHLTYDVLERDAGRARRPTSLVLEGVNVLQRGSGRVYVSDFVDFALYLDAEEDDVRRWYLCALPGAAQRRVPAARVLLPPLRAALRRRGGRGRDAAIWERTNRPNLLNNIQPTRPRADVILEKGADHFVSRVLLRRT